MSLRTDLPQFLLAQTAVTSLLGASNGTPSVFPVVNDPGDIYPSVVITVISNPSLETHDGPAHLSFAHVQFGCFAKTPAAVAQIRDALKALLESFTGVLTPGTTAVGNVMYLTDHDEFESGTRLYSSVIEMEFQYSD